MDNQANYAIELRELTKTFGEVVANDKVSLTMAPSWWMGRRSPSAPPRTPTTWASG